MNDNPPPAKSETARDQLADGVALDDFLPYLMNRITNRLNLNLLEDLRPLKINVPRWRVLAVLHARDGRNIGELAAYTVMDQSTLSRVIDQMERDGLVERRPGPGDSRVVCVHILEAGNRMFEAILPHAMRHMQHAVKGFSAQEKATLLCLLHKVLDNIKTSPSG